MDTITTRDGKTIAIGEVAYDFYADVLDDNAVVTLAEIRPEPGDAPPWGVWQAAPGVTTAGGLLDGSRVCSLAYARRQGWLTEGATR